MISQNKKIMFKDRVTIYEVAKVANVSLATVSRVINNHPNVTEKTRKKVNEAIDKLGYKPSALAQGLANSRSTNIGIMIPSTGYSYVSNMLDGMIDIAKIYGYITSIFITKRTKEDAATMINLLIKSHVDGAVIFDDELGTDEIRSIQNYHIPLIVIGHELVGEALGSIILEYKKPLLKVLENDLKNTNDPLYILDIVNEGAMIDELRDLAYNYAVNTDHEVHKLQFNDSYSIVYDGMKEFFKNHKKGYFITPRDSLAAAIINAATDSNLKVPDDVQVLACIGNKYSYIARPQISTFALDMFKVGSIAVRMLTKLLSKDEELDEKSFVIEAVYKKRESTK